MELKQLLEEILNADLYQMILSNSKDKEKITKAKIRPVLIQKKLEFQKTDYVGTKVYHENFSKEKLIIEIERALQEDFKQLEADGACHATVLVSKKGKMTIKKSQNIGVSKAEDGDSCLPKRIDLSHNRQKKYLLPEGTPVPFLIDLGVQTQDGKIVRTKYDKFKQINRFLELIDDIIPALPKDKTIRILDFGCGKSYLTFASYYYLHEVAKLDLQVVGLDLKEDVIEKCNALRDKYGYTGLNFEKGNIKDYTGADQVDMVITLHACDTATDFALEKAVKWGAKVILSVPCCQHEVNKQISCKVLEPVLKYGIIKERMSALITDALRAEILESYGYETQILEFIDMEHTPKNLMIRGILKNTLATDAEAGVEEVSSFLQIHPILPELLKGYNR